MSVKPIDQEIIALVEDFYREITLEEQKHKGVGGSSNPTEHKKYYAHRIATVNHDPKWEKSDKRSNERARRIVAAWNLCVGIPTEELEAMAAKGQSAIRVVRIAKIRREELEELARKKQEQGDKS